MSKANLLPRHIAIVMDGNGRWAKQRSLPRIAGHKVGFDVVREVVKNCIEKKIEVLTLFAFSHENWQRPENEVSFLMNLFLTALEHEVKKLHKQNVKVRIIGDRERLSAKLREHAEAAEKLTENNTGLKLMVAVSYSGRWDIENAIREIAKKIEQDKLSSNDITAELIQNHLALADVPEPDLFIRTSGEQRISNFLLWQLAYTELYFTDVFWPDFNANEFDKALDFFKGRERRFGFTGEQIREKKHA